MFIHIGNDNVIRSRDIVSIIDCSVLESSSIMEEMIESGKKNGIVKGKSSVAKSVIITSDFIYYSSLSVLTLKKRSSIRQMVKKFKNHSKID